jgi:hypothetical protein
MKTFEAQRMIQMLTNDDVPEETKINVLNQSVSTLSEIAFDLVVESVSAIKSQDTLVDDPEFIRDFLQNADKDIFNQLEQHLIKMKTLISIAPLEFESSQEHIDMGAPKTYTMPLNMDQSSFFVLGS